MASPRAKYLKYMKKKHILVIAGTPRTQVAVSHSLDGNCLHMRYDHKNKICLLPG